MILIKCFDNVWSNISFLIEIQQHRNLLFFGFGRYGTFRDIIRNLRDVTYQIDIEMYPGIEIPVPENPSFGTRDVHIELSWDNPGADLAMSLIGPGGEEILTTRDPGVSTIESATKTDLHIHYLGEVLPEEEYNICVFSQSDLEIPVDFTIQYSWKQNVSRQEGDMLASATQAAVLASQLNAPLLFSSKHEIPNVTMETLYQLGVDHIYLIDLGDYLNTQAKNELSKEFHLHSYTEYKAIYDKIRGISNSNDIIFSTIQPWTSWYVAELQPDKQIPGARFIGPAAYIAAIHGSPVLYVDNHPELSSSLSWHTEFWRRHSTGFSKLPTVSEMHLTGTRVYEFLKSLDFDKEGQEIIITVAGQYDIGLSWDRTFVGKAQPGRFIGTPTDISVWISRNMFYPMLVFQNPAIKNTAGVPSITGSSSIRRFPWRGKLGLRITDHGGEQTVSYPVLNTLICYTMEFNTRASKYWGFEYACTDGTIPGVSPSMDRIDDGVMKAVSGAEGSYFADMCDSTVIPFYLDKGGYTTVYSTNFDANIHNLNQGMLLWFMNAHGSPFDGGSFLFWDSQQQQPESESHFNFPTVPLSAATKETNPWRAYEWLLGSTEEPDTMTADIHGLLPMITGNPNPRGIRLVRTAMDYALARRPIRDILGSIASLPILRHLTPQWFQDTETYYDGVVGTVLLGRFGKSWYTAIHIDDALDNLYSCGIICAACFPAGNYLHLVMVRRGSPFQIIDPWATSWYSSVWQNMAARGIPLGQTVGEFYTEGITKVGIQYVHDGRPNWWWDLFENVCLYGDPNLRIWTPSTEFSSANHWTVQDIKPYSFDAARPLNIDGHTPFGAETYSRAKTPPTFLSQYGVVIGAIMLIILLLGVVMFINRKPLEKNKNLKKKSK
ncbi:MAG: cell wall-binding repeat-containing protein [Thermoplasmatota archaeon]